MSMAWAAARKLRRGVDNLRRVLAVELVCAARRLDLRAPLAPAAGTGAARRRAARAGRRRRARPVAVARPRRGRGSAALRRRAGRGRVSDRTARCGVDAARSLWRDAMTAGARPGACARAAPTSRCRGWPQEAAYRMLQNNLDPEVAERPDDLVVYGGTGRAARSWDAFDAMCRTLTTLADDETMLVQSGKPVGVFRTHEWAPRVLIANSNLVPGVGQLGRVPPARGARPHDVRPDDRRLVDLHRHAGHPAGHVRVLRRDRPPPLRRHRSPARSRSPPASAGWAGRSRWRSR